jgi:hypothetical protein
MENSENNENSDDIKNKANIEDPFWLNDYKILFIQERLIDFFPTISMTLIQKLNAIMRMAIYLSIGLYLISGTYQYLYIMILIGAFTCFIYYTQKDNVELYFNSNKVNDDQNMIAKSKFDEQKIDIKPTVSNPFMNINLITDNKTQSEPKKSWNDQDLKKDIEDKFGYNLYRDVGDLYGKSNSQRQYYTMPSTTIPNNQTSFAKWCYSVGPTCKEKSIYCTPEMNQVPYVDTSNPYLGTDTKY